MNPPSSEPNPHLEFDLSVPAPSQEQPPLPEPEPPPLRKRNYLVGIVLFCVVLLLVVLRAQRREDAQEVAMAKRVSDISDALKQTKTILARKPDARTLRPLIQNRKRLSSVEGSQRTLQEWKTLATSPNAYPSDFRRYALSLSILSSPLHREILPTLSRVSTYKASPMSEKPTEKALLKEYQSYIHPIPVRDEQALWEAIYGKKALDTRLLPEYLSRIEALRLGWFAAIAKHDLYRRAGKTLEAETEYRHARASGEVMLWVEQLEAYLILVGLVGWGFLIVRSLNTKKRGLPALMLLMQKVKGEMLTFGYHPRIFVFVTYLILPFTLLLISPILSALFKGSSALTMARGNTIFYLVESTLTLVACAWLLRHRSLAEGSSAPMTLREVFVTLGWNAPTGAWWLGVRGYILLLLPLLLVTALSRSLFRHFETPSHPIILSMALMNTPFDWFLLLLQTSVLAPIVEETLFRGVLYPALRNRMGVIGGIAMTSTIFAILHPTLPAGFLPLFLLGAVMAYLYEVKKSLVPGIVLHALNNGLILILQLSALAN
ncbi:hypothetical protein LBMAG21_02590 [Armatimonadota bacterium]|nr:hypothetical protein LBMAG21_02590 [Armatimonadota bacterium]